MKSIFRYPGGKSGRMIQEWIISHRWDGFREYREPFVGGGGVFFGIRGAAERAWINDMHEGLIAVYAALRDRPKKFIAKCRAIAVASPEDPKTDVGVRGGEQKNGRLKKFFDNMKLNTECDQALRYFFVNRTVHGSGRVNYDIPSRLYFSNEDGWNITATKQLEKAADVLKDVQITCGDYAELLDAPGEDVWIYCDPPYAINTALSASSRLYQYSFEAQDHRRFAEVVKRCQHKVCISYDEDADGFVRSLFPEPQFHIVEGKWKYAGTSESKKRDGAELLILNYEPPSTRVAIRVPDTVLIESRDIELLEQCEREIEQAVARGRDSYVEIGRALARIRDSGSPSQRIYRATHATFEDYCRDRWGMSPRHANRLIDASRRYDVLRMGPIGPVLPATESQLRELARLESDEQAAEVWERVVASVTGPKQITAAVIRKHVNAAIGHKPAEKPSRYESLLSACLRLNKDERQQLINELAESISRKDAA